MLNETGLLTAGVTRSERDTAYCERAGREAEAAHTGVRVGDIDDM